MQPKGEPTPFRVWRMSGKPLRGGADYISLESRKPWYTKDYVRMRKEAPNRVVLAPKHR
jgi:hypothetical protein